MFLKLTDRTGQPFWLMAEAIEAMNEETLHNTEVTPNTIEHFTAIVARGRKGVGTYHCWETVAEILECLCTPVKTVRKEQKDERGPQGLTDPAPGGRTRQHQQGRDPAK